MKIFFVSSNSKEATDAKNRYIEKYKQSSLFDSDIIVPIGGDGFLLKNLHDYNELKKPFFGINYGSIGFLMNSESGEDLKKIIESAQKINLKPLEMTATNSKNEVFKSIAYNEVSLMRQSHQAAKIEILINNVQRMDELICDGILVATAAGSTAYNLSAHGSIIPLDTNLLALTPISAFRPRRWKGAILSEKTVININIINSDKRPTSVTADNHEYRDIVNVEIKSSNKNTCNVLFDKKHSIEEKILKEQFSH